MPKEYVAESLLEALASDDLAGKRVLLPRAAVARDLVPVELTRRGAIVDVVEAYRTVIPEDAAARAREVLARKPTWITFTSSSTVRNFVAAAGGRVVGGREDRVDWSDHLGDRARAWADRRRRGRSAHGRRGWSRRSAPSSRSACRISTAHGTIRVGPAAKILAGMSCQSSGWRIEDLKIVARKYDLADRQHGTSHVTFRFPERPLVVMPARRADQASLYPPVCGAGRQS